MKKSIKNNTKKLMISLLAILLIFNFMMPNFILAINEEDDISKAAGILQKSFNEAGTDGLWTRSEKDFENVINEILGKDTKNSIDVSENTVIFNVTSTGDVENAFNNLRG